MFEFGFGCFVSLSNGSNSHLNISNLVQIWIRMLRIPFKWFKIAFQCFEMVGMVRLSIRMLRIPFEWFEFTFECFESLLNGSNFRPFECYESCSNLDWNASNPFQMVRLLSVWLEFSFECFESLSNG